jgi:ABC-type branched-subunit amino acid transport system substrate-binding protein
MARRVRRFAGALVVLAVCTAALTTTTSAAPSQAGGGEVGLTPSTMNITFVYGDTTNLQQAGVLAKIGDVGKDFQVFTDMANKAGGAGGRQLQVSLEQYKVPSTATDERPSCVSATEDDHAFIVVYLGGQTDESLLCAAQEHQRVTLAIDATARPSTFAATQGRLFTNSMSAARLMQAWVLAAKNKGLLKGKMVGIVRPDDSAHAEVSKALNAALKKAGVKVVQEVSLPCTGVSSCSQSDVAAQKLQSSGVNTLFSLLPAIPYPSFVQAAGAIGYKPQYLSSDYETQVYNTTAKLFGDAKASYDGAIGISTTLAQATADPPRVKCNQEFTQATGTTYAPLTDAWNAVGSACAMVGRIVQAANAAQQSGGLTQAGFLTQYAKLPVVEGNRKGEFGPAKFDAYDTYQLFKFGAGCLCWQPIKGTTGVFKG